jgi:hypothetical protein
VQHSEACEQPRPSEVHALPSGPASLFDCVPHWLLLPHVRPVQQSVDAVQSAPFCPHEGAQAWAVGSQ